MLTLNQIHAQIVSLANAHYQIAEVGMGTIAELQGKPDRLYPLLWLSNEGGSLEDNYKVDNIRLTMFGRVIAGEEGQDDDASEIEVLSDMQLILLDFLNYFHQQHGQEYVTDKAATLEHFTERTNDRTAGYSCVLELKQFYDWNKCQIPQSGASIPPTIDGLTLYDFCDQSVIDRLTPDQVVCLEAEFGDCDPVTIKVNGVEIGTADSGTTYSFGVEDRLGNPIGTEENPSVVGYGKLTVNGTTFEDEILPEATYPLLVKLDGVESGTFDVPNKTVNVTSSPPSLDITVYSDVGLTTPITNATYNDTVYIQAVATGITPNSYTFYIEDSSSAQLSVTQAGDTLTWTVELSGTAKIQAVAKDASSDVTAKATPEELTIAGGRVPWVSNPAPTHAFAKDDDYGNVWYTYALRITDSIPAGELACLDLQNNVLQRSSFGNQQFVGFVTPANSGTTNGITGLYWFLGTRVDVYVNGSYVMVMYNPTTDEYDNPKVCRNPDGTFDFYAGSTLIYSSTYTDTGILVPTVKSIYGGRGINEVYITRVS